MNKKLVLSSVNQVITLVKNNPSLSTQILKFAPLGNLPLSTTPQKSCNCGGKQNIVTPDTNKQVAEQILSSLTNDDFVQIKNILDLEQLCYYRRDTVKNNLELVCV